MAQRIFLALAGLAVASCGPSSPVEPDARPDGLACEPGAAYCSQNMSWECREDGSGYDSYYCDPLQGAGCDIDTGRCGGPCAPQALGNSYIGCEYYPTVTGNEVNANFSFAVAISNTTNEVASITIDWGALEQPARFEVPAGGVRVFSLPWVPELKGCMAYEGIECSGTTRMSSAFVPKGAYHLRSTQPVTVYQFNPLDYARTESQFSYTNDASLLLPANAMTGNYVVVAWPYTESNYNSPALLAITATRDDTRVVVTPTAATVAGAVPALAKGQPHELVLHQGDVVELFTFDGDLTGTTVEADAPVQVIAGHFCTFIPSDIGYCDHLEESMFPVETLSNRYVLAAPAVPSMPEGKQQFVRIVAIQDDTQLQFDPPQAVATSLARAGDFVEIPLSTSSFVVEANHRILVSQYMVGEEAGGETGDPAMALAVPTDQYRREYLFHAPRNYEVNYVNVVAPMDANVLLDGEPLAFTPIGASGFGLARQILGDGLAGNHELEADQPVGVSVYGYGQYTSYWYPGGLDLEQVYVP